MESTLEEIQTTQSTLAGVMEKIQNYIMQDADQDKTPSVDERLAISEPLHPPARLSGETVEFSEATGRTVQKDLEDQFRGMKERYHGGLPVGPRLGARGPKIILTMPSML